MKSYFLLFPMILCLFGCKKGENSSLQKEAANQIAFGQIDSIYSEILGESRQVWIHLPINASEGKKYPVLYLLDGPENFYAVTGMIHQLSTANGNAVLPEMIVVAIPNTNRNRDLTPTKVAIDFHSGDSISYQTGGGSIFLDFMERELIPYIDRSYPTAPYRTYVGHSFGGLSVINALVTKPHLFNNYIAIDPSLWWDDQAFLHFADSVLATNNFAKKACFVGIANTMRADMEIGTVGNDTSRSTTHIRSILQFVNSVDKQKNGLTFAWKYYEGDDHGSVPLIATYDALRFLFHWYWFKEVNELTDTSIAIGESMELVQSHYKEVSRYLEYEVLPDEGLVNSIGYFYLDEKQLDKADAFFDLNIRNYPQSSDACLARGDGYLAAGDSTRALALFRKALDAGNNKQAQEKIDLLTKKMGF